MNKKRVKSYLILSSIGIIITFIMSIIPESNKTEVTAVLRDNIQYEEKEFTKQDSMEDASVTAYLAQVKMVE